MSMQMYGKIDFKPKSLKNLHYLTEASLNMELCLANTEYLYEGFAPLAKEFSRFIENSKVKTLVHLPFYGLQLGCKDTYIRKLSRELVLQGLKKSIELEIFAGVMHAAFPAHLPKAGNEKWLSNFCREMEPVIEFCHKNGFTLYLENTWEFNLSILKTIFSHFSSSGVYMCLDIAHIYCFTNTSFDDWWQEFSPIIRHVHLSDNNFDEDSHLCLGNGRIDYPSILHTLQGKDLTYTLETDVTDFKKSVEYIKAKIPSQFI